MDKSSKQPNINIDEPYHENSHDMVIFFKILAFSSTMVYNVYNYTTYEVENHDRYAAKENDHTRYS